MQLDLISRRPETFEESEARGSDPTLVMTVRFMYEPEDAWQGDPILWAFTENSAPVTSDVFRIVAESDETHGLAYELNRFACETGTNAAHEVYEALAAIIDEADMVLRFDQIVSR